MLRGTGSLKAAVLLAALAPVGFYAAIETPAVGQVEKKAPAPAAAAPASVIGTLDRALLEAMKSGQRLGYAGRYKRLSPVLDRVFNFPRIAQLTLGSNWGRLDPGQQKQFVTALRNYTIATYAGRFDAYAGERFAITGSRSLQPGTVGVFTTFTEKNGKIHRFDYLLQKQGNVWQVINVVADGVSDLSLKRAEYTDTLEKKGFGALLAHLQKQMDAYASGRKK